jgi:PAS domain S-box-containing protein
MRQLTLTWGTALALTVVLVPLSQFNFLLFHSIAEVVAVAVLLVIFALAFAARESLESSGLFVVFGYSAPFIALVLLLHMLAYKGLGVFPDRLLPNLTTQLWMIARFLLSATFLAAVLSAGRKVRPGTVAIIAAIVTGGLLASVSVWPVFPVAFDNVTGLTTFKIIGEYVIIAAFAVSIALVIRRPSLYDRETLMPLLSSLGLLMLAEFAFTLYGTELAGVYNIAGHLLQIVAFQALYLAIVEVSVRRPLHSLFRELKLSEERVRAKADYYERLYELAPVPYQSLDEDGNFLTVNKAWEQVTGFDKQSVIGRPFSEILSPDVVTDFTERFKHNGEVHDIEWRLRKPDGAEIITEFDGIIARADDGSFLQTHCVLRDVTDRRRVELNQREQAELLEEEVRRRTRELEQANAAKGEFLANVSHELRTPLNSIIGFSDILLSGLAGDLDDEQRRQLQMIRDSGGHLLSIVNDILDLARVDVGKMELTLQDTDLPTLVKESLENLRPLADAKSLKVSFMECGRPCGSCLACVDPVRVRQVLNNLIGNAVKFTTSGGIAISLDCDASATAYVRVTDTGLGLDKAQLEQVFDEFIQVAGRDGGKPEGTGLGLPLSRRLARAFGGEVLAHSTPGEGSTFTLVLPLSHPEL